MKIVVLDGYVLNPGDLSWKELESLGDCTIFDRSPPSVVIERAKDAEIILTNKTVIDRSVIAQLPKLRYIGVMATGYNVVDLDAARERGILVTSVPAYSTTSVAQFTFALILELACHVGNHSQGVRQGRWTKSKDFSYWDASLVELDGLAFGIMGYGSIGKSVALIARAFGMKVLVHTRNPPSSENGISFVEQKVLFEQSDILSLHCPLSPETENLINKERLSWMKTSAFLINTSRGKLVVEKDLAEALNLGRIAGAGLDVLVDEPPREDNPLLTAKNCVVTPHIGWATLAARKRLMQVIVQNVQGFILGKPQNVIKSR